MQLKKVVTASLAVLFMAGCSSTPTGIDLLKTMQVSEGGNL
jgi:uncharacterized lipoprotein YajG